MSIQLAGIPVPPKIDYWDWLPPRETPQIDLYLSIHFNEQWEPLHQGRIKFGLRGGELRLRLVGGEIPIESRYLGGCVELLLPRKEEPHQERIDQTNNYTSNSTLTRRIVGAAFPKSEGSRMDALETQKIFVGESDKDRPFHGNICHITKKVSEPNPTWIFEEEIGKPVLKGFLDKVKLATLNVTAFPCRIQATFEVSGRDICITDAEGLWQSDMSRNKMAVLEQLTIKRLLEPKFKPYLSRVMLRYERSKISR
ncbi:MAG TPA: hypothetical protein DEG17_23660 [Cyanobacteria bacterium UBA11149]|nr:hypothetical protein [Cyanobacteria bacterium UBA11367]HBE58406.1 hypothetical protein [Cyanobacteria bacterium UBA11366]HBK62720.1 hypothetical protein [Cyanobacteria bacterium UBA11166]HBR75162.1 hypothetical protein [Cyanobacteria bacterium UBA11159]HBS69840.1 hypothetical protein [Cyanobacteria bacterium UBA11153]HBW91779.1 hypothetical protein [Cyanobacteria bacterium UBA11149]HCA93431.1 hypothetical protein [Cyanobacteria bacterium UBA9226]